MTITEVRFHYPPQPDKRVLAYVTVTIDNDLAIHDIRLIQGEDRPFVSMPSRKPTIHCGQCGKKHATEDHYCPACGYELPEPPAELRRCDIVHPINAKTRQLLEASIIRAYNDDQANRRDTAA